MTRAGAKASVPRARAAALQHHGATSTFDFVRARWVLLVTMFLAFVAEAADAVPYTQMISPFGWAHTLLFEALPDKIRGIDHITAGCLIVALGNRGAKNLVAPARKALLLSAATTVLCFVYGVARSGGAWQASWQIYLILSAVLFAFAVAATFRTVEQLAQVWKVILWAAAYRAGMCCLFYAEYVHTMRLSPAPEYLTSHDDTVLWVVAMLILLLRFVYARTAGVRIRTVLFLAFIMLAVLYNQRRIAWVSLVAGSAIVLSLMPASKHKRRAMRILYALAPVVLLYVAVGWGRSERIFKPLQSFATVTTQEDNSTKARNMENLGLIATSNANSPLFGSGWGHPYIEVSNKYSIAGSFPLWQYVPHNSILGLLAFTGILGFYGYWLVYPTAMFFNARVARLAESPLARQLGLVGAAQLVVCANQFYGDMGIYDIKSTYILALGYAFALRLPVAAGVWPVTVNAGASRAPSAVAVPAAGDPGRG